MQARAAEGAKLIFDSSKIPGEIMDLMVVKTAAPETLKKALAGAWYETMTLMNTPGPAADEAIKYMAEASGATVEEFKSQLTTTAMFYEAGKGAAFAMSADVGKTMEAVRQFSFSKGLFGQNAKSVDDVGIELADRTLGNEDNVKLRFTAQYMQMAAEGKL
jgi:NitT/TauT family transport system substrate-binding protein